MQVATAGDAVHEAHAKSYRALGAVGRECR